MPQVTQLEVIHTATDQTYLLVVDDRISKRMNYTEFRDQIISDSPTFSNDDIQGILSNLYLINTELVNKADSDHTQPASSITDLEQAVDSEIVSVITAGTNITLNYSTITNQLIISSGGQVLLDQQSSLAIGNGLGTNLGTNNFAVGIGAMLCNLAGSNNSANGYESLRRNSYGGNNIAVGYQSLRNNGFGNSNIAMGYQAMNCNDSGDSNVALGYNALFRNTIGTKNIAVGEYALYSNTIGSNNIAHGHRALVSNSLGTQNIAIGDQAMYSNISGGNNIAIGAFSSCLNTAGGNNIAVGGSALNINQGSNNVAIGNLAGSAVSFGNNNTIIGSLVGTSTLTNTVLIGSGTCERVKVNDAGLFVNGSLFTGGGGGYSLPTASTSTLGGVKIDGTTITILDDVISSNGGSVNSRTTASVSTFPLAPNASGAYTIVGFKGYVLYSIETSGAAWVVLYSNAAAQSLDSSRAISMDPAPGTGVIAEAITTGTSTQYFSPAIFGYNNELVPTTDIPIKIYNNGVVTSAITITLTLVKMEA